MKSWLYIRKHDHLEYHVRDYWLRRFYRGEVRRIVWWMPSVGFMYGYKPNKFTR